MNTYTDHQTVHHLLTQHLKPKVTSIDEDGLYPGGFLKLLGKSGFFSLRDLPQEKRRTHTLQLIETVAEVCNSTAFSLWCHFAAMNYVRKGQSEYLKQSILPLLENGDLLGGTGLSNPMKFYANMEPVWLKASKSGDGYRVSGTLPFVSNLGPDHWFGIVAEVTKQQRIMVLVPCQMEGLTLIEKNDFLALNGTATYSCQFKDVSIPSEWILSEHADHLVETIRTDFVLHQTGLAIGLIRASIDSIQGVRKKQNEVNQYVTGQTEDIQQQWNFIRKRAYDLAQKPSLTSENWRDILRIRLDSAQLALESAQAELLHFGAAGYTKRSHTSRRLREAYFIAILSPAMKHLQKLLSNLE